jgi:hypothetical protein
MKFRMTRNTVKAWGHRFRRILVISWACSIGIIYGREYIRYLYSHYPRLQQLSEIGLWGMIQRYFTP